MKSEKLVNCKVCGEEVAKNAKICPHCGAKLKKTHPILIGVVTFFVLIGIIASFGDDEPKKVETETPSQNENVDPIQDDNESGTENKFLVGETAELKGVNVTLVNVSESKGSAYNEPNEGNVFVICEFEIANNSDKEIAVSSMMSFDAYCDDYACTFSLGAMIEKGNKNQLDGTVAAGKKFNGVVGYEVPEDWQELEIVFTPDFWSGKDIIFIATNS